MKSRQLIIFATLVLLGALVGAAQPRVRTRSVTCKSRDFKPARCSVDGAVVEVRLVRQKSGSACKRGETFGFKDNHIWVSGGCAGKFDVSFRPRALAGIRQIACKSKEFKRKRCSLDRTVLGVRLVEQKSNTACVRGKSFGFKYDYIWVDKGCAGEFEVTHEVDERGVRRFDARSVGEPVRQRISCKSRDFKPKTCRADGPIQSLRLHKQKSNSPCILGETFGYRGASIWVTEGCSGEFDVVSVAASESAADTSPFFGGGTKKEKVKCRSKDFKLKTCRVDGPIETLRVSKQKSNSPCIEGKSYGFKGDTIWVDKGCYAEFKVRYRQY